MISTPAELLGLITCLISFMSLNFGSIVPHAYITRPQVSEASVECFEMVLPSVIKRMRILMFIRK